MEERSSRCIYTVSSSERIKEALLLAYQISQKSHNQPIDFYIFLSDNISLKYAVDIPIFFEFNHSFNLRIIQPSSFDELFFLNENNKRTDIEKVVAFKAYALAYLLGLNLYNTATYFDSDVLITRLSKKGQNNQKQIISIAPHTRDFLNKDLHIYLRDGALNTGYFIFDLKHKDSENFVNFFINFCRSYCYHDRNLGLFVDQKAFDLAQMFFKINVIENTKSNWAYWNLNESQKNLDQVDEFFHFSGFNPNHFERLSLHQKNKPSYPSEVLELVCDYFFLIKSLNSNLIQKKIIRIEDYIFDRKIDYHFVNFNCFSQDYFIENKINFVFDPILGPIKALLRIKAINTLFRLLSDRRFYT